MLKSWLALVLCVACGESMDPMLDAAVMSDGAVDDDAPAADALPQDAAVPDSEPPSDAAADVVVPLDAPLTSGSIRGRVTYEKKLFDERGFTGRHVDVPSRGVAVELAMQSGSVLAEGRTDDDGRFELPFSVTGPVQAFVRAYADARSHEQRATAARFTRGDTIHSFASPELDLATATAEVELRATVDSGAGGAFNIVEQARAALAALAPSLPEPTPRITYGWEMGESWPCGSCYGNDYIQLGGQVEDPDEYDDDIVLHELGHHFVRHHSADDSPGGPHRDRQVEPTLAYGEGVAYFFTCMMTGRSTIIDNYLGSHRYIDVERMTMAGESRADFLGTSTGGPAGRLREEIVTGIMWDAFDDYSGDEPFDTIALGFDGMMEILIGYFGTWPHADQGARGIDLADFLHALSCRDDVTDEQAQALANDRAFPWSPSPSACE